MPTARRATVLPLSQPDVRRSRNHELIALGVEKVATGQFGADMQVYIQNDGPVTIVLDTDEIMPKRVTVRKAGAKENA